MQAKKLSVLLLFCALSFTNALTYTNLTLTNNVATKSFDLDPCELAYYAVQIPDPSVSHYLSVTTESIITNLEVYVSDEPFTADMLLYEYSPNHVYHGVSPDCDDDCVAYVDIDVICTFPGTNTWYITVQNSAEDTITADVKLTATIVDLAITETTIGTTLDVDSGYHNGTSFADSFDFYHFTVDKSAAIGEVLIISVNNTSNSVNMFLNGGSSVPAFNLEDNSCSVAESMASSTLLVDYCIWGSLATAGSSLYLAIQPELGEPFSYSLTLKTVSPQPILLTANADASTLYGVYPAEVVYFSFSVSDTEQFVNATISNVQGGTVDFSIEYESLPFILCEASSDCNTAISNCCNDVTATCQLVIQPCVVESGTYYLGVRAATFFNTSGLFVPITFEVAVSVIDLPDTESLSDSEFESSTLLQSHYAFYEFNGDDDDEEATFNVHLYVDRTSKPGTQTFMYVNYDEEAGADGSCWSSIDSCSVTDIGSCSIQINPCLYAAYDDWYVSVFGGDDTVSYGTETDFTVLGKLDTPVELDESFYVISTAVYDQQLQHYHLDGDLLPEGAIVFLVITDTKGGDLEVFMNYGDLAGPVDDCTNCFNSTDSQRTGSNTLVWPIANCDDMVNDNRNEIYFAVQGLADDDEDNSNYVGYSITVIASDNSVEPSDDLDQNSVLVDSIEALSVKNYTMNGDQDSVSAYMLVSITQINFDGDNPLILNAYNTSNLNCIMDSYSQTCTVDSNGYCSFVIQNCNFNTSDAWIAEVINPFDEEIHYNIFYDIYGDSAISMENGAPYAGTVFRYQYQQFEYEAAGEDTLIIEVFFDQCLDINGDDCIGNLYVSMDGPTGPEGCFFQDYVQSDSDKCVYVVSSCDLPEATYYFSVGTTSNLYPHFPFAYTITVTEMSSVVPVTTNVPLSGQIYSNQKIYHTFSYTNDPSKGSRVAIGVNNVQNGDVSVVVAQSAPPSTSGTCPCFEYSSQLYYEYCNAESGEWTVLIQANADEDNEQVGYILNVITFSQTPAQLTIGTNAAPSSPTPGSVTLGEYNYYAITQGTGGSNAADALITLQLSTIANGYLNVYFATEDPATVFCNTQTATDCMGVSSSCLTQIGACVGYPSFVSVFAPTTTSYEPVTYTIELSETFPINLQASVASDVVSVRSKFYQYFFYNATGVIGGYQSPQVTFTVNNAQSSEGLRLDYELAIKEFDVCSPASQSKSCGRSSCSISLSDCSMGSEFYLSVENSGLHDFNFTVTATIIDIAASPTNVPLGTTVSAVLNNGEWQSFTASVGDLGQHQSLTYTLTTDAKIEAYFGYNMATPGCADFPANVTSSVSHEVNACCVQEGDYYLAVYNSEPSSANITVNFFLTGITSTAVNVPTGGIAAANYTLDGHETQEFVYFLNESTPYVAAWTIIETDQSVNFFGQHGSPAAPINNGHYCATPGSHGDDDDDDTLDFFLSEQCTQTASLATPYEGGTYYFGVQNSRATSQDIEISIRSGVQRFVELSAGQMHQEANAAAYLPYYYSFNTNATSTQNIQVFVESEDVVPMYLYQGEQGYCGDILSTASSGGNATLTYSPCSSGGMFVVKVQSPQTDTSFNITFSMVDAFNATDVTDTLVTLTGSQTVMGTVKESTGPTQFATLMVSNYTGTVPDLHISYVIEEVAFCLSPMNVDCFENLNTTHLDCTVIIDACELATNSHYYFDIKLDDKDDTYSVSFKVSDQGSEALGLNSVVSGAVQQNQRNMYNLTIDYTALVPGNNLEIKLVPTCGEAMLYVNQGYLAGPDCAFSTGPTFNNIFSLNACDLLEGPSVDITDPTYYVSVVGGTPSYPDMNLPVQYLLQVEVSGAPATFRTIGPNQRAAFGGQNIIYAFPVTGLNDFVGQLQVTLISGGGSASLDIGIDRPTLCQQDVTLSVTGSTMKDTHIWSSCDIGATRQIYFSFTAGSDTSASFELTHLKPFVRDLDVYTAIPQAGAVVPSANLDQIIDEEYYRISLDPSAENFQFKVWLESEDTGVTILSSQDSPPSLCTPASDDRSGREITWDWCEVELTDEMYLTVVRPATSMGTSASPYQLYYSKTVDIEVETLTANTPICDTVEPKEWNYYTAGMESTTTQIYSVEIYAVNSDGSDCSVDAYLSFDGLATPSCAAASKQTCTGTCQDTMQCEWVFDCPMSGNMSLGVWNNSPKDAIDYFVVWKSENTNPTALTVGTPMESTSDEQYFSFTIPSIDPTSQYLIVHSESTSGAVVNMRYNSARIPGSDCADYTCQDNGGCSILVNPCGSVPSGTGYIYVSSSTTFTVTVTIYDANVIDLPFDYFAETSLTTTETTSPLDLVTYKVSVTSEMIANSLYGDMTVSVYGVNQGNVNVWVSQEQIGYYTGENECSLSSTTVGPSKNGEDILVVDSCVFTAADYYISASLAHTNQLDSCTDVTFGIMVTMSTAPGTPIALTAGQPVTEMISTNEMRVYSFSSSNDIVAVSATTSSGVDLSVTLWDSPYDQTTPITSDVCYSTLALPTQYFWLCEDIADKFYLNVNPASNQVVLPGSTYTLEVSAMSFTNITDNSVEGKTFTATSQTSHFYTFSNIGGESVQIDLEVTQGPGVTIDIYDAQCSSSGGNQVLTSLTCYSGHCEIPFSWANGAVFNTSYTIYMTVSGSAPSTYNLQVYSGEEETCVQPGATDLCDISWSIWDYHSGDMGIENQASAAELLYNELVSVFCPPCGCSEVSKACNDSLIEFACTQTYRACNDNGLQTSICEDTCEDIEENCGYTFEQVGYPWLSCNHNFYYGDFDSVCEDIYDITETDSSDVILWIVIVLVVLLILLLVLGAAAFFGYKKFKASRQKTSYDEIADDHEALD